MSGFVGRVEKSCTLYGSTVNMRKIFPSILSPASSGESPRREELDKECISVRPARSRSPFKWGRSSTPVKSRSKTVDSPGTVEKRLAHPEMDLSTAHEDECEEKQVLSERACSPTAYFQSAHRMRAFMESEMRSTAESRYRPNIDSPTQMFSECRPALHQPSKHTKRTKSAPRLRTTTETKNESHGAFTVLSNFWHSPGRSRPGHTRTDSSENMSTASTCGSNSFGERRETSLVVYDEKLAEKAQVKYKAARSVAEKLAKAIRGSSKSSPKEMKHSNSFSQGSVLASSHSNNSTRALKSYLKDSHTEGDPSDYSSEIVLELPSSMDGRRINFDRFRRDCKEVFPLPRREVLENEKEREEIDTQLRDYWGKVEDMYYRAQERAREAEQEVETARAELASTYEDEAAEPPRVRELLEQRLSAAMEAASEARLRVADYATVTDGVTLVKKRLEFAEVASEREKTELQLALEEELQRREAEWIARLEKAQMEEMRLKGRVRDIAESNVNLQKEMASMAAREKGLREQIRQYEEQVRAYRKKLEEAEKVILEIRESSVNSRKQNMHTEDELVSLRKKCQETEDENTDLRKLVGRLQQMCTDHEKSIQGLYNGLKNVSDSRSDKGLVRLQNELCRLSSIELSLRRELEASNREAEALRRELKKLLDRVKSEQTEGLKSEVHSEIDRLKAQIYELQEQNSIASIKLSTASREERSKTDALREMESRKKVVEEEVKSLQEELRKRKMQLQDKDKDFKWLETRLQAVVKTNRLLQGIVAKQAAFRKKTVDEDGHEDTECDLQKCLEVSAEQLNQMSERVEMMKDKLLERESELFAARTECGKKDVVIQGLEQKINEQKKTLETRIQRLTGRNEELFRLYNAKEKEIVELQTKIKEETELRRKCEAELEQVKEQANDLQEELKVQGMHCNLLREKLCAREVELEHQDVETKKSVEDRQVLKKDTAKLQTFLDEATQRIIGLEHKLAEKEEKVTWLQRGLNDRVQDWTKVKEELVKTRKERDAIKQEAEELGREALRTSAEVEVLRRKVGLLEEDLLVKEGELSILQGELED